MRLTKTGAASATVGQNFNYSSDLGTMTSAANPITIRLTLRAARAGTLTNGAAVTLASPNDPNSSNNSQSVSTRITALTADLPAEVDLTYRSSIDVEPGNQPTRGQIVVNGASFQATDDGGEYVYRVRVGEGLSRLETRLDLPAGSSGFWRFDFSAAPELVQVLSQDGSSIVFAVGGGASPPRFTFEIGEGRRHQPR
jgi:hypothetical protein